MIVRAAAEADHNAILAIIRPVLSAGETYAIDPTLDDAGMLAYWFAPSHTVFVAEEQGKILGTYYLMANQGGGGAHVANCGYIVGSNAQGKGVARTMCQHSLEAARTHGFRAMQFNHVVSTNRRAVALWQSLGFAIVGTLPEAFHHPAHGYVDSYVMFKRL